MKKSKLIQISSLLIIVLSLWFIFDKLWIHHKWLITSAINSEFVITVIICSFIYGISEFLLSFAWRKLIILCGHKKISLNLCNKIYGKSQIAKYIPGNIFHVVGRHLLGTDAGIKHLVLTGATILEILGLLSTSILISLIGMTIFGLGSIHFSLNQIIIILIILIIIFLVFYILGPYLLKTKGLTLPFQKKLHYIFSLSKIYINYVLFFFISGLLLIFIVKNFLDLNLYLSAKLIILFSIAWIAGFIVPGAPGGIGIREVVIIFFISPIIGEAQGIAVAFALRFVTLIGDVWFFIISNLRFNHDR